MTLSQPIVPAAADRCGVRRRTGAPALTVQSHYTESSPKQSCGSRSTNGDREGGAAKVSTWKKRTNKPKWWSRFLCRVSDDVVPANSDQRPTGSSGHKVLWLWPHSLQAYSTRPWSTSALTRLGAPHLLHFTSSRVLPCVMITFRAIASLTKRSDSWRIASFDIAGARGFRTINSPSPKNSVLAYFPPRPNRFASPPPGVERLNRGSPNKQIERAHPRCK